jgi:hypothetical protein
MYSPHLTPMSYAKSKEIAEKSRNLAENQDVYRKSINARGNLHDYGIWCWIWGLDPDLHHNAETYTRIQQYHTKP